MGGKGQTGGRGASQGLTLSLFRVLPDKSAWSGGGQLHAIDIGGAATDPLQWWWQHSDVTVAKPAVERRHPPDGLMRLANPFVRRMAARGRLGDHVLLLHYVGRRSGRRFDVPAGYQVIDGLVSVFTSSGWRYNFAGGRDIEVTLKGVRQSGRAVLHNDPDEVAQACQRLIGEFGMARAARQLGLRINLDRPPTREELRDAVQHSGLSIVRIYPQSFPPRLSVVARRAG
jgi:hypothetical protein